MSTHGAIFCNLNSNSAQHVITNSVLNSTEVTTAGTAMTKAYAWADHDNDVTTAVWCLFKQFDCRDVVAHVGQQVGRVASVF